MAESGDLVIADLADNEVRLAAICANLRSALHAALDQLHAQHVELTRLREQHRRLVNEYREYRAATIGDPRRVA